MLFTTPKIAIDDIDISTDVVEETGETLIKFFVFKTFSMQLTL